MGIYVGVNGSPKNVTSIVIGVNGVAKTVSEVYVGSGGGVKLVYEAFKPEPGETIFTSSGNFTVPKGVKKIDIFCVNGGNKGSSSSTYFFSKSNTCFRFAGKGGSGAETVTVNEFAVTPESILAVTVGSSGGISSVDGVSTSNPGSGIVTTGASGGGGGYYKYTKSGPSTVAPSNANGSNGTARYFGERNGTLYAGGGGGGGISSFGVGGSPGGGNGGKGPNSGSNGTANTGGGGGGGGNVGYPSSVSGTDYAGGSGGSGVAIIRWGN